MRRAAASSRSRLRDVLENDGIFLAVDDDGLAGLEATI
jgi:hypothetical protein